MDGVLEMRVKDFIKILAGVNPNAKIVFLEDYDGDNTPLVVGKISETEVALTWHPDYTR